MSESKKKPKSTLLQENEELRIRLSEAEETLRAIHEGEVDAVIVSGSKGEQIFSLVGTDSIYRLIVETMKEAAFTVTFDGKILFCNAQFGQFVKRPLELIVGHPFQEFVVGRNHAAAASLLIAAQQQPVRQRLVFQALDCTNVPAHVSANVLSQPDGLSICVVATDLTELENSTELIQQLRRQTQALQTANEELAVIEEELRSQNEDLLVVRSLLESEKTRYQDLFEGAPDGYIVTDSEGKIKEANQVAAAMFGSAKARIEGKFLQVLFAPPDDDFYFERFHKLRTGANEIPGWEVKLKPPGNGAMFWASITAAAARDEEGKLTGVRWLIRDITAAKEAEEKIRQAAEELKRSNGDLEQFAYIAGHDLQEPLRMVTGLLGLLRDGYRGKQLDAKADQYIDLAVDGGHRMSTMIKDLLEYSRAGSKGIKTAPTDIQDIINVVESNLRRVMEEAKVVITRDPLPTVIADSSQMLQVFQNLIGNAIKFRTQDRPCQVHIGATQQNGQWVFSIRDNGIGIDPKQADRVFMLFQRLHTRDKYPGSGLGLAICKKIVERHGGRIWVESEPGKGSTFCFTLPDKTK